MDALDQGRLRVSFECPVTSYHLVEDASERPYISFFVKWLSLEHLGTDVRHGALGLVRPIIPKREDLADL